MFDAQLLWQNRVVLKDIWCHRVTSRFDDPSFPVETIKLHRYLMENQTPGLARTQLNLLTHSAWSRVGAMVASTAVILKMRMFERLIAGILEEDTLLQQVYRIRRTTGHSTAFSA